MHQILFLLGRRPTGGDYGTPLSPRTRSWKGPTSKGVGGREGKSRIEEGKGGEEMYRVPPSTFE